MIVIYPQGFTLGFVSLPYQGTAAALRTKRWEMKKSSRPLSRSRQNRHTPVGARAGRSAMRFGLFFALLLSLVSPASGITGAKPESSFSQFVPESAELFITIQRLADINAALDRAHAWGLAPMLVGGKMDEADGSDLAETVVRFLGMSVATDRESLLRTEFGVLARSSFDPADAVWFLRVADKKTLDQWFPPEERSGQGAFGEVRYFQSGKGTLVCASEHVVVLARRWGPGSLLRETLKLMSGGPGGSLGEFKGYRELTSYLPRNELAWIYVAPEAGETPLSPLWPAVDRALIGLYEGQGRLDVAVRASLIQPHPKPKLAPRAMRPFLRLPHSTLFAMATTFDFDRAFKFAAEQPGRTTATRYLSFLAALQSAPSGPLGDAAHLGPHALLVWGQDLEDAGATPQFAAMLECQDGMAVFNRARRTAQSIIRLATALKVNTQPGGLKVLTKRHVGARILHVPLTGIAKPSSSSFIKLLSHLDPAWTVWNGWLIVALNLEHLERILDAQYGLVPALATVPDMQNIWRRSTERSVVSVVQPGMAADVLSAWLGAHDRGEPSWLHPALWSVAGTAEVDSSVAGIKLETRVEGGSVVVKSVGAASPAAGKVLPGDRILGVDGRLLPLVDPISAFRQAWIDSQGKPGPTFRVTRTNRAMDVVVLAAPHDEPSTRPRISPAGALRELTAVARQLDFISFDVDVSDERHYSARLTLRFAPNVSTASTTAGERTPRDE